MMEKLSVAIEEMNGMNVIDPWESKCDLLWNLILLMLNHLVTRWPKGHVIESSGPTNPDDVYLCKELP